MARLSTNALANFAGQGWAGLVQLVVIPLYIRLLGIEAYGLVGFYAALLTTVQIFDLGLSQTMTRELARLSAGREELHKARDLVRSASLVYWALGIVITAAVVIAAPYLVDSIIKTENLSRDLAYQAIVLMAIIIPLQWAINLRVGALIGLEHQISANVLRVVMSTVNGLGTILVLWLVANTITAFFWWQILAALVNLVATSLLLERALPARSRRSGIEFGILRQITRFATGMSCINVLSIVVTQLDKWILVGLMPLKTFGYYSLAVAVANSLYMFITPVFTSFFPRFSFLVRQGSADRVNQLYRFGMQVMVVAVIPAAVVLSLFSEEVLLLWTSSADVSSMSAPLVSVLVIGVALNGLMNIPYAVQLAHGWTGLAIIINVVSLACLIPALFVLTLRFGASGAATAWVIFNVTFTLLAIPATHRRLLPYGKGRRVITEVLVAVGVVVGFLGLVRLVFPSEASSAFQASYILGSFIAALMLAAYCGPQTREWILRPAKKLYQKTN